MAMSKKGVSKANGEAKPRIGKGKDVSFSPSNFEVSQNEHKKINSYFLIIFIVGIIIAFLFYELSTVLNQSPEEEREKLFNKFFSKEIGLVVEDNLNVSVLIEAKTNDAEILRQRLGTDEDFCIIILDAEDNIIYDEKGEPLYVCTTKI